MPKASYFLGKIGMVLATVTIQVIVLMALRVAFVHVDLPATAKPLGDHRRGDVSSSWPKAAIRPSPCEQLSRSGSS